MKPKSINYMILNNKTINVIFYFVVLTSMFIALGYKNHYIEDTIIGLISNYMMLPFVLFPFFIFLTFKSISIFNNSYIILRMKNPKQYNLMVKKAIILSIIYYFVEYIFMLIIWLNFINQKGYHNNMGLMFFQMLKILITIIILSLFIIESRQKYIPLLIFYCFFFSTCNYIDIPHNFIDKLIVSNNLVNNVEYSSFLENLIIIAIRFISIVLIFFVFKKINFDKFDIGDPYERKR